jgi:hypothetical protein
MIGKEDAQEADRAGHDDGRKRQGCDDRRRIIIIIGQDTRTRSKKSR